MLETKVAVHTKVITNFQASPYADIVEVQTLLRELLLESGLGVTDMYAPFRDIIEPGMTVLIKPNWVLHENYSGKGNDCLVTHPNLIVAVLQEVLKAKPGRVIIGDAPVQGCDFDTLVPRLWREKMKDFADCPVDIIDFRRTILRSGGFADGQDREVHGEDRYVLFDLGKESLLESVTTLDSRFRITCYDPDQLAEKHRPGRHQYLLCREPFEADVILNLPKLKTHKKAGITAALKNLVGLNGNKEYLPHHRLGGVADGGDCYPGYAPLKRMAEYCLDEANRKIGTQTCSTWLKRSSRLISLHSKFGNQEIEGGWYGNDTVWRMALDLNRILLYGRSDGTLSDVQLRKVYSLTDGIIAGEGEGPLAPTPVNLNVITFAASSAFADLVHASIMRFDFNKIPLVRESFNKFSYPLVSHTPEQCRVLYQGKKLSFTQISQLVGIPFKAPAGWKGHIEI